MPRNAKRGGGDGFGLKYSQKATDETPDDNFKDATNQSGPVNGLDSKWTVVSGDVNPVPLLYPDGPGTNDYDLSVSGRARMTCGGGSGAGANDRILWRQDWTLGQDESIVACMGIGLVTNQTMASRDYQGLRAGICLNNSDTTSRTASFVSCGFEATADDFAITSDTNLRSPWSAHAYTSWSSQAFFRIYRDDSTPPAYYCYTAVGDSDTWHQLSSTVGGGDSPNSATLNNLWFEMWPGISPESGSYQITLNWIRLGTISYDPWSYQ